MSSRMNRRLYPQGASRAHVPPGGVWCHGEAWWLPWTDSVGLGPSRRLHGGSRNWTLDTKTTRPGGVTRASPVPCVLSWVTVSAPGNRPVRRALLRPSQGR